jgi:hypothetical protein
MLQSPHATNVSTLEHVGFIKRILYSDYFLQLLLSVACPKKQTTLHPIPEHMQHEVHP